MSTTSQPLNFIFNISTEDSGNRHFRNYFCHHNIFSCTQQFFELQPQKAEKSPKYM